MLKSFENLHNSKIIATFVVLKGNNKGRSEILKYSLQHAFFYILKIIKN